MNPTNRPIPLERTITMECIPFLGNCQDKDTHPSSLLQRLLDHTEYHALIFALEAAEADAQKAAQFLGISRTTFYRLMRKHGRKSRKNSRSTQ